MKASVLFPVIFCIAIMFIPAVSAENLKVTDPVVMAKVMERNSPLNEVPFIMLDPIADHPASEKFIISARTNLGEKTTIQYYIISTSLIDRQYRYSKPAGTRGNAQVTSGDGFKNTISLDTDMSGFLPDEYFVEIYLDEGRVFDHVRFNIT